MRRLSVFLASILLLSTVYGCGGTGGVSARPSTRHRANDRNSSGSVEEKFDISKLETIAFLGFAKSVLSKDVLPLIQPVIEDQIMATDHPYIILTRNEVEIRVNRESARALHAEVIDFWMDKKNVDKFKVTELCEKLGVDALLLGNVEEWMQSRAAYDAEDPSYTQISATLSIYLGETGREIWKKQASKILEAAQLDSRSEQVDLSGGSGVAGRGMKARKAGDPPRYDEVVPFIAEELANALK